MAKSTVTVFLDGIGLAGPGLNGWVDSINALNAAAPFEKIPVKIPVSEFLPAAERRRVGNQVKLALAVGHEAVKHAAQDAALLPNVFSASQGDGENCNAICQVLAGPDRQISPTRFHNSVHNASAGYWGIAMNCMASSTSLCAFDGSFAVGLLEASVQAQSLQSAVLMVASDTPYPEPLHSARPINSSFAVGMVVNAVQSERSFAKLAITLSPESPTLLTEAHWEQMRLSAPAARCLPLLMQLASSNAEICTLRLDYLDQCSMSIELEKILI
jgi:Beta-ketoacyl synthase, N-terminal domain